MLTEKQLEEIREHLNKAQNPIFFFDNDVDGLTSFLLLQRYIERGKGVAIRGTMTLTKDYFKKVRELNADYIFILDKPITDKDFFDLANEAGLPVVYIDHHNVEKPQTEFYYNTFHASGKNEPTSYLCYNIVEDKKEAWISAVGCIGDGFMPEFLKDVKKAYPELFSKKYKSAFDVRFGTEFGKLVQIMNFGLLDATTNVLFMIKFLLNAKNPSEILEETGKTKSFLKRYETIQKKIDAILKKAEKSIDKQRKLLFFIYSGDMSLSQHVSDELMYKYPELVIAVGFLRGSKIKFSLRAPIDVRDITLKAIENLDGATGGGHKHATGAQIASEQVEQFKQNIITQLEKLEELEKGK